MDCRVKPGNDPVVRGCVFHSSFRGALKARTRNPETRTVPVSGFRVRRWGAVLRTAMPGHDCRGTYNPRACILTLILYDIIPNSVRSARGRSHEASCGWDRMRRPRPGEDVSPAPGRRRELRPAATMSRPPGAWLSGADRPPCASPKTRSQGGSNGRSLQSAARRSKEDAAMARHEAPASLERERGTERTMVAPPGAPSPSACARGKLWKKATGLPRASTNNMGDNTWLTAT
jgi:hypothetical protein